MQRPTLENVTVRTVRDATHIFYAVARNLLPIITRRLDADERRAIKAGNVYVWEDRGANSESSGLGMERWTDGMSWGPSRVRDEFLYYTQKEYDPENDSASSWIPALRRRDPSASGANSSSHAFGGPRSSRRPEHLMKQTYSVHVFLPQDRAQGVMRKWHLTAYFSQETVDSLTPVSALPGIGDVTVPEGWFRSARSSKTRRGGEPFGPGPGPFAFPPGGHSEGAVPPFTFASPAVPPPMYSSYSMYPFPPPHAPGLDTVPYGVPSSTSMSLHQGRPPDAEVPRNNSGGLPSASYAVASYSVPAYHQSYLQVASTSHDAATSYASIPTNTFHPQLQQPQALHYEHGLPRVDETARSATSSPSSGASSVSPSTPANNASDDSLPRSMRSDSTPLEGMSLVPLEYLQNKSCPPRDPADQEMMRRLGVLSIGIPVTLGEVVGAEQPSL